MSAYLSHLDHCEKGCRPRMDKMVRSLTEAYDPCPIGHVPAGPFRVTNVSFEGNNSHNLTLVGVSVDGHAQLSKTHLSCDVLSLFRHVWGKLDTCRQELRLEIVSYTSEVVFGTVRVDGVELSGDKEER